MELRFEGGCVRDVFRFLVIEVKALQADVVFTPIFDLKMGVIICVF